MTLLSIQYVLATRRALSFDSTWNGAGPRLVLDLSELMDGLHIGLHGSARRIAGPGAGTQRDGRGRR